jgi:CRP/FNR family cyclic AMP-dependent transcriptional regulator
MSTQQVHEALRECSFLRELPDEDLARISAIGRPKEYGEGEILFREGEPATNLFIISSGSVALEICAPGVGCRRIMTLGPGELLSWSSVLDQTRQTATARAIGPTQVIAIQSSQLLMLCEHDPALGYALMRRVALAVTHRLTAARMQLLDVFGSLMPSSPSESTNKI